MTDPANSGSHHGCGAQPKPGERFNSATWMTLASDALAAAAACLCCSLPLIPLMVGLSAGSLLMPPTQAPWLFDALGWAVLLVAFLRIWRRHRQGSKDIRTDGQFWLRLAVTAAVFATMTTTVHWLSGTWSAHQHGGFKR